MIIRMALCVLCLIVLAAPAPGGNPTISPARPEFAKTNSSTPASPARPEFAKTNSSTPASPARPEFAKTNSSTSAAKEQPAREQTIPSDVTYTAKEYAFSGPDEIAAGWITTKLVNAGDDLHQMQFLKLPEGRSVQDFAAEITDNYKRLPHWVHRQGGPNSVIPGEYSVATVHLDPGNYVLICGIPDRRGVPHVALGMLKALRVTPGVPKTTDPPHADVTITEEDFTFQISKPIRAGRRTIRVVNNGSQAHEVVLVQLARRATANTFLDDFQPGVVTSPLGKPVGGMVGLEPGGEGSFTIDFMPGRYGLICFLPDLSRGAPHFTRGMLMDLNVE